MNIPINLYPDRPKLEAENFSVLVDLWLTDLMRRLEPNTIKGYRICLDHFIEWWSEEGPLREWVLGEDALATYAQLVKARREWSWWRKFDALRRLRQVLRWANQRGLVAVDFSDFVPGVKGTPRPKNPVHIDVLRAILAAAEETKEPERNRAIVAVLAGTGVRCEECATMRVEDVILYEDGSGLITLTKAKNGKLRTVAFDQDTAELLCEWIVMLPYDRGPLFPSRFERNSGAPIQLTPHGIYRVIRKLAELGDVGDKIQGPHDLRRMFATTWARILKGEGHLLQKQLGHTDYNTTLRYVISDPNDIREAMAKQRATPIALLAGPQRQPLQVDPRRYINAVARAKKYIDTIR